MTRLQPFFATTVIALGVAAASRVAIADAIVEGDLRVTPDPRAIDINADTTTDLLAFSKQQGEKANATSGNIVVSSGIEATNPSKWGGTPGYMMVSTIQVKQANGKVEKYAELPTGVVGLRKLSKTVLKNPGDKQEVYSRSGDYRGVAQQSLTAAGASQIRAFAENLSKAANPPAGRAAGAAYDPYPVPGGTSYYYSATINATFGFSAASEYGALDFYAVDSTVFTEDSLDNFLVDGSPFEDTLWTLSLSGGGILTKRSQIKVDFDLNPDALDEISLPSSYLTGLTGYRPNMTDGALAALIDHAFDDEIADALIYDSTTGTVSLSNYPLFPTGTLYEPDGSNVDYADGVNAGLTDAPEPRSLWLLVGCLIGLTGAKRAFRARATVRNA